MRHFVAVLLGVLALAGPAGRIGAADPSGESAQVALSIEAATPKGPLTLTGTAAYERRGSRVRVDLKTLSLSGAATSGQTANPIPPGGYSVVYDVSTMVYTIWSPSRRTYFSGKGTPTPPSSSATPAPTPGPSASPGPTIASVLAGLKDLQQFVISLSLSPDKTPIDGHPTTNFDFHFARQVKAQDATDVTGRASFADDLGGIPLLFTLKANGGPSGIPSGSLRAALSDVKQTAPPQSDFGTPAGYKKGSSIFDVIMIPGLSP